MRISWKSCLPQELRGLVRWSRSASQKPNHTVLRLLSCIAEARPCLWRDHTPQGRPIREIPGRGKDVTARPHAQGQQRNRYLRMHWVAIRRDWNALLLGIVSLWAVLEKVSPHEALAASSSII